MENLTESRQIKIAFGIPFDSMDLHEFLRTVGTIAGSGLKQFIFAASTPWLLDFARNPLLKPKEIDYLLAADSTLTAMADKSGIHIKMPLEYFEFPEQLARVCANYGYSLLYVSEAALKTNILTRDNSFSLSWDLFTHFKISGKIDQQDTDSIISSVKSSKPDIVLISAFPECIKKYADTIYQHLPHCLLICIPQDMDKKKFEDKIDNIFTPFFLMKEEIFFLQELSRQNSADSPTSISCSTGVKNAKITISGTLNRQISSELIRMSKNIIHKKMDLELDLSRTRAISINGLETIFLMNRMFKISGYKLSIQNISDEIINFFYQSGLHSYFISLPGITAKNFVE